MSRKTAIEHQLAQAYTPVYLQVEDESKNHHVPKNAETHFKIILVSDKFTPLSRLARHRLINKALEHEFTTGLHALSLHLYSPAEWESKKSILASPSCKDGYKNNI